VVSTQSTTRYRDAVFFFFFFFYVLENPCYVSFTYEIEGRNVNSIGNGVSRQH
jgi:hypothetical protein